MRARMVIAYTRVQVELREILLKDKPQQLLELSSKATVPVLKAANNIFEESLEIMFWALKQNDSANWYFQLSKAEQQSIDQLIDLNDNDFKTKLDKYKYAARFPEFSENYYFNAAIPFLSQLNQLIQQNGYIINQQITLADVALFPFIRQFASVNQKAFEQLNLIHLNRWHAHWLDSALFKNVMIKYPQWKQGDPIELFPR